MRREYCCISPFLSYYLDPSQERQLQLLHLVLFCRPLLLFIITMYVKKPIWFFFTAKAIIVFASACTAVLLAIGDLNVIDALNNKKFFRISFQKVSYFNEEIHERMTQI